MRPPARTTFKFTVEQTIGRKSKTGLTKRTIQTRMSAASTVVQLLGIRAYKMRRRSSSLGAPASTDGFGGSAGVFESSSVLLEAGKKGTE